MREYGWPALRTESQISLRFQRSRKRCLQPKHAEWFAAKCCDGPHLAASESLTKFVQRILPLEVGTRDEGV